MNVATLRADCARCAALCCVALAFDRSDLFAFDKAADEICPNLSACGRCRIHAQKAARGFAGCAAFDCAGAGQRVTQELFGGRSWREDAALLLPMLRAFETMRVVQEMLLLLSEAEKLPLPAVERERLQALAAELEPGWTRETLTAVRVEAIAQRVRAFLKTLRGYAVRPA